MATRILSGIRPTGNIHLGNYLGAIKNWVSMADSIDETLFCIVDQHALTTAEDASNLYENTRLIAAAYVACGINPDKSYIFAQSHVPGHTELAWYFNCVTPLGWLNRMTQFKDKAGKNKEHANLGLYSYPVLMAADILLYKATHVPVGEDQKQHVELARDIAGAFNNYAKHEIFTLPEPVIPTQSARIMSLRDGTKKMSKSDISDYSRIHLTDDDDTLALKIRKAKTDMEPIPQVKEGLENRPEAKNLMGIYSAVSGKSIEQACLQFEGQPFSAFKSELTDALINHLEPIRRKLTLLLDDKDELDRIITRGATRANILSQESLSDVKSHLNLYPKPKGL
ncbi:MAG: tryptophan--tRNA ligase [Candidatus Paracaedibacteraceae bacterium]|nr:tryptophan--tRNA ligase [Candidatus Paracaedibacteraceae bacterium]